MTSKILAFSSLLVFAGPAPGVKDAKGNLHSGATATVTVNRKDFGLTWNK
jgi:polyisoprenoid-binding protein YceI